MSLPEVEVIGPMKGASGTGRIMIWAGCMHPATPSKIAPNTRWQQGRLRKLPMAIIKYALGKRGWRAVLRFMVNISLILGGMRSDCSRDGLFARLDRLAMV